MRDPKPLPRLLLLAALLPQPALAAAEPRLLWVAPFEALRVAESGVGPPVVLIPGLFGSAFGFRKVLPMLAADGWRAVVIEPLAVGESSRPADADYSLTAQATASRPR